MNRGIRGILAVLILTGLRGDAEEPAGHRIEVATITRSASQTNDAVSSWSLTDDRVEIRHLTLFSIILHVYPHSVPIIDEAELSDDKFDVLIKGQNPDPEDFWIALTNVLREKFQLSTRSEQRQMEIYEIRKGPGNPPGLKPSSATEKRSSTMAQSVEEFKHFSMDDLEDKLGDVLQLPVYNETGLTNFYNFSLDWTFHFSADKAIAEVNKLGLRVEKVKKEKEVLVITKANAFKLIR